MKKLICLVLVAAVCLLSGCAGCDGDSNKTFDPAREYAKYYRNGLPVLSFDDYDAFEFASTMTITLPSKTFVETTQVQYNATKPSDPQASVFNRRMFSYKSNVPLSALILRYYGGVEYWNSASAPNSITRVKTHINDYFLRQTKLPSPDLISHYDGGDNIVHAYVKSDKVAQLFEFLCQNTAGENHYSSLLPSFDSASALITLTTSPTALTSIRIRLTAHSASVGGTFTLESFTTLNLSQIVVQTDYDTLAALDTLA